MDDLLKLIVTLRERIDSHQVALGGNEALTRSVLIDPLLRALGWDTEDPAHVIPEYRIPSERKKPADYALFAGSDVPVIIVEAKKLGESLSEAARQAVQYCTVDGYKYFAVTDGCEWTLYETHRSVALNEKQIVRFDLRSDPPIEVCSRALGLWRQRFVESGSASVEPVAIPNAVAEMPGTRRAAEASVGQRDLSSEWTPLSKLVPEGREKPQELRLPSREIQGVASWAQLVVKLTRWLIDHGHLTEASLPIRGGGKSYLVAMQPKHRDGRPFRQPAKAGRFFVDTSYSGPDHARNMRAIIESAGKQTDEFAVRTRKPKQGGQS